MAELEVPMSLSKSAIKYLPFSGATRASIISGLAGVLVEAGWTATSISGGYSLTGTSPQGLTVGFQIWDNGQTLLGRPLVSGQFFGNVSGAERYLCAGDGYQYRVWANCCQFFVSRPAVCADPYGSALMGGAPWIPEGTAVEEAWWSMADGYKDNVFTAGSLRTSLMTYANPAPGGSGAGPGNHTEAAWNGVYCGPGQSGHLGYVQVPCYTTCEDMDYYWHTEIQPSPAMFYGDIPLVHEPLLVWGNSYGTAGIVRACVWDSLVISRPMHREAREWEEMFLLQKPYSSYQWVNYTDAYPLGSLWLLFDSKPGNAAQYFAY
jgi:hypothetical protein